jgi:hypothetical protein
MIIKQTFTVMEVRRRGAEWARMNPSFTRDQREARRAQFSEAWGDGLAQQFYFGAVDEVR